MKSLRVELGLGDDVIHPMHAFVADHDAFERTLLLHWNPTLGETNALVFRVEGTDPEAYAAALSAIDDVLTYRVHDGPRDEFHVYVRERLDGPDATLTASFTRSSLVVVPPVEYRSDRSMVVTVVGTGADLQSALDEAPPGVDVDVRWVSEYDAGAHAPEARLTDRQFEAVRVAVEAGYYGSTREATVAEVAAELDCAPTTAAEHLRKAEARVMRDVVRGRDRRG
jgi:hypothetical protein